MDRKNFGISDADVQTSRLKYGNNKLPEPKLKKWYNFFFDTFKDTINLILLGMLIVFTVLAILGQGSISEPTGIGVVLVAVALIGVSTNMKTQKSDKELRAKTSIHFCNVIRSGNIKHISTDDIVVGDVIILQTGEAIYADGYLIEGDIKVNNSVLNGESEDCKKIAWENDDEYYVMPGSNENVTGDDCVDPYRLFAGAIITEGEGKMLVTNVGINTLNGKTVTSMQDIKEQRTSLEIQLDDLAKQISKFGYVGAIVIILTLLTSHIFTIGFSEYFESGWMKILQNVLMIITTALTIIVAAVPEGLPLIINIITAQNAKVMLKNNILAKHTNKIPEAGNIQLLCTDKTGTLTRGMLVPVHNVTLDGNEILSSNLRCDFIENVCLNNSAMFDNNGTIVGGNATERALLLMVNQDQYNECLELNVTNRKPFNSAYKYSAAEVRVGTNGVTYYKGAPEKLLSASKKYQGIDGEKYDIDIDRVSLLIKSFTSKAMRVIALAYSLKPLGDDLPDDLVITSLVAIRDDVRKEVPDAVRKMHEAGVQVMMITGDVIDTAKAIARDSGLMNGKDDIAISATDLDRMNDDEVKNKLSKIKVIARATPQTKLRIVKLAQEMNLCVGMTGDGSNDGPALKAADVGFSMGSGTDVCKEAGDIIITDDNFVSITNAVLLGRTFMHNVMKFLKFQLPINVGLVILSILFPIITGYEALAAVQILIINIVMDGLNSLSFGGEPAKDEYMKEKPIPKGSKLLSKETVNQIAISTVAFVGLFMVTMIPPVRKLFGSEESYLTARFAMLVIMATINGFNIRTDHFNLFKGIGKNKLFIEVAISIFTGIILLVNFGGSMMHCSPLSIYQWGIVILLSLMIIPIDMVRKYKIKTRR